MILVNLFPALLSLHWSAWFCNVLMTKLSLSFVHGFEVLNNQMCCPSKFFISLRICYFFIFVYCQNAYTFQGFEVAEQIPYDVSIDSLDKLL